MQDLQKSSQPEVKRLAAEKMLFLINERVEGISDVAFNIIEMMGSTSNLKTKQIAHLIAPYVLKQEEGEEGDRAGLLLLTVNNFKKDFQNLQGDCVVASFAINTLSSLCDPDLSSMIYRELFPLFTCTNPVIRKKVFALCVKIFLNSGENEEIIEELSPYLADRLKDANASVRMAAVSAIYEISRVNP